jgi:hypothetical protein
VGLRAHLSRHDTTAVGFLSVAADLMDAYLQAEPIGEGQSQRLGHITFPTALDWLRTDDVIRLSPKWSSGEASRRRAFFGRWPTRNDFLADALVYALLREPPTIPTPRPTSDGSLSELVSDIADELLTSLIHHPRSYLVLHLGPLLPRYPTLAKALLPSPRDATRAWLRLYHTLADRHDLVLRPEWTHQRLSLVLQAMLDGFVLQYRVRPGGHPRHSWKEANLFADAAIALLLGAIDWDLSGQQAREALDQLTRSHSKQAW